MNVNRRRFLKTSAAAVALPGMLTSPAAQVYQQNAHSGSHVQTQKMRVGVINWGDIKSVKDMGFTTCQISPGSYTPEEAEKMKEKLKKYKIHPSSLIVMGPGNYVWNFIEGPSTIGLVPREGRQERIDRVIKGIDYCQIAGIPAVHALPESADNHLLTGCKTRPIFNSGSHIICTVKKYLLRYNNQNVMAKGGQNRTKDL